MVAGYYAAAVQAVWGDVSEISPTVSLTTACMVLTASEALDALGDWAHAPRSRAKGIGARCHRHGG